MYESSTVGCGITKMANIVFVALRMAMGLGKVTPQFP